MERFSIQRHQLGGDVYAVDIEGDVDLHAAPVLKAELLDILAGGGRTIIADLGRATLFDSTTLGVLLAVTKRIEATDATLSVVCNDALLAFVVQTGLDRLLHVGRSRQALHESLSFGGLAAA
jgi:anti-sigma B factor antagonist